MLGCFNSSILCLLILVYISIWNKIYWMCKALNYGNMITRNMNANADSCECIAHSTVRSDQMFFSRLVCIAILNLVGTGRIPIYYELVFILQLQYRLMYIKYLWIHLLKKVEYIVYLLNTFTINSSVSCLKVCLNNFLTRTVFSSVHECMYDFVSFSVFTAQDEYMLPLNIHIHLSDMRPSKLCIYILE